jgi:hypothetical protein
MRPEHFCMDCRQTVNMWGYPLVTNTVCGSLDIHGHCNSDEGMRRGCTGHKPLPEFVTWIMEARSGEDTGS